MDDIFKNIPILDVNSENFKEELEFNLWSFESDSYL
jgi:hypothetical protein